jgi:tetratricopeptide (TPR) repeat protein
MNVIKLQLGIIGCILFIVFTSCSENNIDNNKEHAVSIEDSLKKQISVYPDSLIAKENLLQYYRDSGMYEIAIRTNLEFLKKDSFNPRLHHILALLYLENEDSIHALDYFSKAYNLYNNPFDLTYAGALYARWGNEKSLICADTILTKFKEKSAKEAWLIKGVYYSTTNQNSKALTCFDSAIQFRFSFIEAYIEKAQTLIKINHLKEAISTLNKAVTITNNLPEAYYMIGDCEEKLHETDLAIEAYEKALMYDPDHDKANAALQRLTKP